MLLLAEQVAAAKDDAEYLRNTMSFLANGFLVPAAVAYVTAKLGLYRFKAKYWWNRKVSAYERVLASLHRVKRGLESDLARYQDPDRREGPKGESDFQKRCRDAWDTLQETFDTASFLLSEEAAKCLSDLRVALEKAETDAAHQSSDGEQHFDIRQELDDSLDAMKVCISKLPQLARNDLRPEGAFRWIMARLFGR